MIEPFVSSPLRVLIVEENRDAAIMLGLLCEEMGHRVARAYDGYGAVEVAHQFRPDIVLLDLGLPGLDGFEVARRVRADSSLQNVLIIAVTGSAREEDRRLAQQIGVDHYLVKPADPQYLASLLRRRR